MAVRGQRNLVEEDLTDRDARVQANRRLERRDRGEERRTWRTEDRVFERTNKGEADLRRVVREVHAGFWGMADERRGRLHRYGYDADEVEREVALYRVTL